MPQVARCAVHGCSVLDCFSCLCVRVCRRVFTCWCQLCQRSRRRLVYTIAAQHRRSIDTSPTGQHGAATQRCPSQQRSQRTSHQRRARRRLRSSRRARRCPRRRHPPPSAAPPASRHQVGCGDSWGARAPRACRTQRRVPAPPPPHRTHGAMACHPSLRPPLRVVMGLQLPMVMAVILKS